MDNRTAPHRTILEKKYPHRTAPWRMKNAPHRTAPHRTAPNDSQNDGNRTESHPVISKMEKTHRGEVLHREKPWSNSTSIIIKIARYEYMIIVAVLA